MIKSMTGFGEVADDIYLQVQARTDNCMIAGGYARDLKFSRPARDMDIIVYGTPAYYATVVPLMRYLQNAGLLDEESTSECYDEYEALSYRLLGVLKTTCNVDIIFWGDDYKTEQDVIDTFDYNINQFVLRTSLDGTMPTAEYLGKNYGALQQVRDDGITAKRKKHVEDIAWEAGWRIPPSDLAGLL